MKLKKLIQEVYDGNYKLAAEYGGTTEQTVRNWVCEGREVLKLANEGWILESSKTKIFESPAHMVISS